MFEKLDLSYTNKLIFSDSAKDVSNVVRGDLSGYTYPISLTPAKRKEFETCVDSSYRAPTYLKWVSDDIGYGVFASEELAADKFISIYSGKVFSDTDVAGNSTLSWAYPICGAISGKKYTLSAKEYGDCGRFFNDARSDIGNNLSPTMIYSEKNKNYSIVYYTNSVVKKDQELCVSYGSSYWANRK